MVAASFVTPLDGARAFSKISFWWLNPLMTQGRKKPIEDKDIPLLCEQDRAKSCYNQFNDRFNAQEQTNQTPQPSILRTIILCYWKDILISGFYALMKIITLTAGPLFLNAFIDVAEGQQSFKMEGYLLAIALFFSKIIESLSQRHWYFKCRVIGIKVRSLLTAAIYKKQQRLSSAAKKNHSGGEIMNYITMDAYRIGEFPYWFHQTWTTGLQVCLGIAIMFSAVGLATFASLFVIVLTFLCGTPIAKVHLRIQPNLMTAQDKMIKAISEALVSMRVLKLYAWEGRFKKAIEDLRAIELIWLSKVQLNRAYKVFLFWASPVLVSTATFVTCYLLGIPLTSRSVFTFVATVRIVQDPVRTLSDVIGGVIQASVSFTRVTDFLEAPELESGGAYLRQKWNWDKTNRRVFVQSADLSWEDDSQKPTLRGINLDVKVGEKIAICGEVGSGKSSLLAAILGEVPVIKGNISVYGNVAYVSQSAWIQTGSIRDNILFGSSMDNQRYQKTLENCSLVKDLELLPFGDLTEIGERGVNLSGGQKQRIQLARALYRNADIYLLDDPFSAVDAHTASSLFNDYVLGALAGKTVLLVTHQVDFLPAFDSILLMSNGEIKYTAPYHQLLSTSQEFQDLVNAHKDTAGRTNTEESTTTTTLAQEGRVLKGDIINKSSIVDDKPIACEGAQLIKKEEKELGDRGIKPYMQYLNQNKGLFFFSVIVIAQITFIAGNFYQNYWMADKLTSTDVSTLRLIVIYFLIGLISTLFLAIRSFGTVVMGMQSSKSIFLQLSTSLFSAPMSFYDSTPIGRILSRISSDLSTVDIDIPFSFVSVLGSTSNAYTSLAVLAGVAWPVLFITIPMIYLAFHLQRYYFSSAKELMRINGTSKSLVANHVAESVAGATTIRAFEEEERFFEKNFDLIDENSSPYFHSCAANEWLIQRIEILSAIILSASALFMVLLPPGTLGSGFVGLALSYGLSLSLGLVLSIQNQCTLANYIISVERLNQYMHLPSEAPPIIPNNRPPQNWPSIGAVDIQDLQIKYREDSPLVLDGITCKFEGGHKIGIVGRTGSGKTTLISALFRLVEPVGGRIVIDGIDISTIGLHDLRSSFGVLPQDPTLFNGSVRYNLDPLSQHTDQQIWEVLHKCQLGDAVLQKKEGLDSIVAEDGSNWSMGQRQLFCLGRALLRKSKILVLDEATASIDNATDLILQRTIRKEFADSTVITVAHRIPTVMDCTMVLALADGKLVEYDEPTKLMKREDSLFGQLVKEYWSHFQSAELH